MIGLISKATCLTNIVSMMNTADLGQVLKELWEQEELGKKRFLTEDKEEEQNHCLQATQCLENGCFKVRLHEFTWQPRRKMQ